MESQRDAGKEFVGSRSRKVEGPRREIEIETFRHMDFWTGNVAERLGFRVRLSL